MFQLQVQSYYLNNQNSLIFNDKIEIKIIKKQYFYDCLNTLQELSFCKDLGLSILCHFLQSNHFAFDSMLYDGKTQTLIFIQITIDKNHKIHYDKIENFIKNKPAQLKIEKKKEYFKKYIIFFEELNKMKLVKKYVYQWITNQIYYELINNSDKKKENLEDPTFLEIFPYYKDLINEINKH